MHSSVPSLRSACVSSWPTLAELLDASCVVRIPMNTRFRGVTHREAMLFRGPAGWGEWSPFVEYGPAESSRWLAAAIEAAWCGWPEPVREVVPVNATVPAVPASRVPDILDRYDGFAAVKVKVAEQGQSLAEDVDRVAAVRDYVGADVPVRLDANAGWDVRTAVEAIAVLSRYSLEYVEQPVAEVDDLARLRRALVTAGCSVRIAADESIRKAEDPLRVARAEAADLIVVKVAPLGGVRRALEIAEQVGLPTVVSSALDTSVGIGAGVALAAALPELEFACGLGTVALLAGDVSRSSLVPRGGVLPVGSVEVDSGLVEQFEAPVERLQWWHQRLGSAYRYVCDSPGL
ncbi:L-Ala-D/L-Glu epimerase [Dermatophilus congolensis]|uniref:o-succinylbenzoate synthase n=1 Tax=Dermatophilus congolensis TaxID=1863 RepID=A0AA46GZG5_9MICO|nr:o-succinylbenzoate synthase [Dermatophilus congolensis]STD03043.1 L-Ala-D/L-Glu epimerase [Dermatophilus congolensis]